MASFTECEEQYRRVLQKLYYDGQPVATDAALKVSIDAIIDAMVASCGGGSATFAIKQISAVYTVLEEDYTIECTSNTFDVTLVDATLAEGQVWNIKNSGTGTITLLTAGAGPAQTIDGNASGVLTLTQYENITIQSNGTDYIIL